MTTISLLQAMRNVNKGEENTSVPDIEELTHELGLPEVAWHGDFPDYEERVVGYWITRWMCTDTWVGTQVIYFDGEPVAIREQTSRRGGHTFEFVDQESMTRLRTYLTHIEEPDVAFIDPEAVIDTDYTINYSSEILVRDGYYMGQPVRVIGHLGYTSQDCAVRDLEGNEFKIPMSDYRMMIEQSPPLRPEPNPPFGPGSTVEREAVLKMVREVAADRAFALDNRMK